MVGDLQEVAQNDVIEKDRARLNSLDKKASLRFKLWKAALLSSQQA